MTISLDALNALPAAGFTALLAKVFEESAWVAERAAEGRPYPTVTALHAGMMNAVRAAPEDEQLAFLRGHPELGGQAARRRELGAHSTQEQAGLDLDRLAAAEAGRFDRMNEAYRGRFGFPFIVCVRRHTRASLIDAFERRLANDVDREYQAAFDEIARITRLRLAELVEGPGQPVTTGSLTTHVLDTARGRPASGVRVQLFEVEGERLHRLVEGLTNEDGRLDQPLLSGGPLRMGRYELRFDVGGYFAASGQSSDFLDVVPIRFTIADPETHYHVPLLMAPGGYTTYRGS